MPGDHIERRVLKLGRPELAIQLGHQFHRTRPVLVGRHGREKIPRVGEPVGTDRPKLRQAKRFAVGLTDIAARRGGAELDGEAHAAGDHRDLAGRQGHHTQLRVQHQGALLGHDQQLAVGGIEVAIHHRAVGAIDVDADADAPMGIPIAADRHQSVQEVRRALRHRQRIPPQAVGGRPLAEGRRPPQGKLHLCKGWMRRRGLNSIEPGAPVLMAGGGEGAAAELLRIEAKRRPLRRVAPLRKGAGLGLAAEGVAEPRHVTRHRAVLPQGHHAHYPLPASRVSP